MSWMKALAETYDRCYDVSRLNDGGTPLLPIYHSPGRAHIGITLDSEGNCLNVEAIPKGQQRAIIQSTNESIGRTIKIAPHGLSDKLPYLVSDLSAHCKKPKASYGTAHRMYMEQLDRWCDISGNPNIKAVHSYLRKGTIYDDLIKGGILVEDENGLLSDSRDEWKLSMPKTSKQQDAFVRWSVYTDGRLLDTWYDKDVIGSWIDYNQQLDSKVGLCYVTGKITTLMHNHPKEIRSPADNCKIISSSDKSEFTYRGRFETAEQACGIGSETSQKAHNALRWLIGRQGYRHGTLCVVAWNTADAHVMNPLNDPYEMIEAPENVVYTNVAAAKHINNRIRGYNSEIIDSNVYLMALDSVSENKGRIAVTLFRDKDGSDFLETLERWHSQCAWRHNRVSSDGSRHSYIGAPSPKDIAMAAYGPRVDERLVTATMNRILSCIVDGTQVSVDIVESVVRRASNPMSFNSKWDWQKTLAIACSLYKKSKGGTYEMALEEERCSRDYLYGRLLALADLLETAALRSSDENRPTNAIRMMQRFSEFPFATWRDIELSLVPYIARLGKLANYYERQISEVMSKFAIDEYMDNSRLSGEFLIAYHCQKEKQFRRRGE